MRKPRRTHLILLGLLFVTLGASHLIWHSDWDEIPLGITQIMLGATIWLVRSLEIALHDLREARPHLWLERP